MKHELSAGGVVLRGGPGRLETVAVRPRAGVLALPKGHPEAGESLERAAEREVREETGLAADLVQRLGEVRYWYTLGGERVQKTVVFFLFRYRSGSVADHDDEVLCADWIPLEEAVGLLSYKGEKEMAAKALALSSA
ncbi:NUDIX hydrolase [soil metagenome]